MQKRKNEQVIKRKKTELFCEQLSLLLIGLSDVRKTAAEAIKKNVFLCFYSFPSKMLMKELSWMLQFSTVLLLSTHQHVVLCVHIDSSEHT